MIRLLDHKSRTKHKQEGRSGKEHALMKLGTIHGIHLAMTAVYRIPAFTTRSQIYKEPSTDTNEVTISLLRSQIKLH